MESGLSCIEVKSGTGPFELFDEWLSEAKQRIPNFKLHMNLATSYKDGSVSNRTIMCREVLEDGFVILVPANSLKVQNLRENPKAAVTFCWHYNKGENIVTRQIRLQGTAQERSREATKPYYDQEVLHAKIRAYICKQSEEVEWPELKSKHDKLLEESSQNNNLAKMPEWITSFKIMPDVMDFYYSSDSNMIADRILFKKEDSEWNFKRVAT